MARRLFNYVVMLFLSTSLGYFLASWFLDPRSNFLALRPVPPEASINASLNYANINDEVPILERYFHWLTGVVLHWNWGYSPTGEPVNGEVWSRAVVSVQLVLLGTVLAAVIGIALAVATAIRKYSLFDRATTNGVTLLLFVSPTFVLALLIVFAYLFLHREYGLTGLYVTGLGDPGGGPLNYLQHLALPTIVLTLTGYTSYHLTQRSYLLDTINADYVRTARSKGVRNAVAIRRHALRTSFLPTVFGLALSISRMVTGVVFVEVIFSIHGAGLYFLETIRENDVNGAVVLLFLGGAATCAGLWLADVVVALVDPRIRIS